MNGQERVAIDLTTIDRVEMDDQIARQMQEKGFEIADFKSLGLGFDLPQGWPADKNCEVTLAQLVVIARKLDMKIVITEIEIMPAEKECLSTLCPECNTHYPSHMMHMCD